MDGVYLDHENKILYVDGMKAVVDGEASPGYMTLLRFRLSRINAEIARHTDARSCFERALAQPERWSKEDNEFHKECHEYSVWILGVLHQYRRSVLDSISFATLGVFIAPLNS